MFGDAAVFLVCLFVVSWLIVSYVNLRRRRRRGTECAVAERSEGDRLAVFVERRGDLPMLIGTVALKDPDFEYAIEELRIEARHKLAALNSHGG